MKLNRTFLFWALWAFLTLFVAAIGARGLYVSGDRTAFLPGETTGVHHQFEVACETCHTSPDFSDASKITKDLNKTCVTCHKEELKASNDSHPIKKFKNPRMAAYWEKIDARFCTSCHLEHQPEDTLPGMVTLAGDFCVACHSEGEQDVRKNRESHADLGYETCATAGCHNFHDNRALYEDFLVKHGNEDWLHPEPKIAAAALARNRPRSGEDEISMYLASLNAIESARDADIEHEWAATVHAANEVGCASCHASEAETAEQIDEQWIAAPTEAVCIDCHRAASQTFALGRHGMRRHPEIAKPRKAKSALKAIGIKNPPETLVSAIETYLDDPAPPAMMSTSEARVSLHPEATGQDVTCTTCHNPHSENVNFTAVEACLTCHNDDHSLSYKSSPHFALWSAELAGDGPAGSGVTCATCHMPQTEKGGKVLTNHNQNDTLRPNEKMIRATCMSCHGLGFAIDALADPALIANNFSGQPMRHIESIDWALKRVEQPATDANQ